MKKIISDVRAIAVLNGINHGLVFSKKAIAALIFNTSGHDLVYSTVMTSGHTEVADATLPAGGALVVQPGGELTVLSKPPYKLYDVNNPLAFVKANALAGERGLNITAEEMVAAAIQSLVEWNGGIAVESFRTDYCVALGKVAAWRLPEDVDSLDIPKPDWGVDAVQKLNGDAVLINNLLVTDAYGIAKDEFCTNWVSQDGKTGEEMYAEIPVLTLEQLEKMADEVTA